MSDIPQERMILRSMKRRRIYEVKNDKKAENGEIEDRLSSLPDGVLLHILSFLDATYAVQTCVLSTRWKYLWKLIPTLNLHSERFYTVKQFSKFASKILTLRLRKKSAALGALDLDCRGNIEPQILKKILNYVSSHNTHLQKLEIYGYGDSSLIMRCVSSCQALTSLKLGPINFSRTIFPKSLNLPALTSLNLNTFIFYGGDDNCVEPFSAFTKLNSLVIDRCAIRDAQTLRISSETLVNLAMHESSYEFDKIQLFTPSLCTFTYTGHPDQRICGSGLSSVKQVNIAAEIYFCWEKPAMLLLSWLQDLANVKSLTVSSTTLQVFLIKILYFISKFC
jgi:hypothetical protein